jgi:hypothetical protein
MINITARDLDASVASILRSYQDEVDAEPQYSQRVALAATRFGSRNRPDNPAFREIRRVLSEMCSGARRCMYCEDSGADEIEHHRPKNLYPELVFAWNNYLYACGPCNGPKNNRFAVLDAAGTLIEITRGRTDPIVPPAPGDAALLDPRTEDPLQFMMLDIIGDTFLFVPTAPAGSPNHLRASYTITLLRLNQRDYLPVARREAFHSYRARLMQYVVELESGADPVTLALLVTALKRMQHPTVWQEMRRQRSLIPNLNSLFTRAPEALTW